jgi:hypothetical protein
VSPARWKIGIGFAGAAVVAVAAGCRSSSAPAEEGGSVSAAPTSPASSPPKVAVSVVPLPKGAPRDVCGVAVDRICGRGECSAYDLTLTVVRDDHVWGPRGPGCLSGEAGTCGPYRYVSFSSGFDGFTAYFDDTGKLVGLQASADTAQFRCPNAGPSMEGTWGIVPSCTKARTVDLCPRKPR